MYRHYDSGYNASRIACTKQGSIKSREVLYFDKAGLPPEGEEVIAVRDTVSRADSVMLARAAVSKRFLDLRGLEVLAKPRE